MWILVASGYSYDSDSPLDHIGISDNRFACPYREFWERNILSEFLGFTWGNPMHDSHWLCASRAGYGMNACCSAYLMGGERKCLMGWFLHPVMGWFLHPLMGDFFTLWWKLVMGEKIPPSFGGGRRGERHIRDWFGFTLLQPMAQSDPSKRSHHYNSFWMAHNHVNSNGYSKHL